MIFWCGMLEKFVVWLWQKSNFSGVKKGLVRGVEFLLGIHHPNLVPKTSNDELGYNLWFRSLIGLIWVKDTSLCETVPSVRQFWSFSPPKWWLINSDPKSGPRVYYDLILMWEVNTWVLGAELVDYTWLGNPLDSFDPFGTLGIYVSIVGDTSCFWQVLVWVCDLLIKITCRVHTIAFRWIHVPFLLLELLG